MIQLTFVELVDRQIGEDMARLTETLRAEAEHDNGVFDHEEWDHHAEQADWTIEDTRRAWGVLV